MIKKIVIGLFVILMGIIFIPKQNLYADTTTIDPCETDAENKFQCKEFIVDTWELFWWSKKYKDSVNKTTWEEKINFLLWTVIKNLMLIVPILSFVVMIAWAWFMIMYTWDDSKLNKWKYMLKAWIIALFVSLTSYQLISLIRFLLYKN